MEFSWGEIILYLLPLISVWLVLESRDLPIFSEDSPFVPVDFLHPCLWICFHILTERVCFYSWIPLYVLILCLLGLFYLFLTIRNSREFSWSRFGRYLSNWSFKLNFPIYYAFVLFRVISLLAR